MTWLINAQQLDKFRKSQKNLIIFDASFHMAASGRDAKKEFLQKHIIDAQFFDIDALSDPSQSLPHMLIRDERLLGEKIGALGIRNDYKVILYDNSELHSACRAAWMLKTAGHNPQQLYILDGGLNAWEKFEGKIETGEARSAAKSYTASFQPNYICDLPQMKELFHGKHVQIVDLRHPLRYAGGPEPRPNMRLGHIPGSFCLPYMTLFDTNGYLLPLDKIQKLMESVVIDLKAPIVVLCGSGITAPILDFVLDIMGHQEHYVYDGSWSEWGSNTLFANESNLAERPVKTVKDFEITDPRVV